MIARNSLLLCLLAASSYAFAVKQPSTFAARSAALEMTGGGTLLSPPPIVDLKVRNLLLFVVAQRYLPFG
jgi:hypothetical protein